MAKLMTINEVAARLTINRATIYDWIKAGRFPAPIRLGERASRWPEDEVEAWLVAQPRELAGAPVERHATA